VGPFPEACGKAWRHIREEVMENYELREGSRQEEWGKIGPIKDPTPADAKNRGAEDRGREATTRTSTGSEVAGHDMQGTSGTISGREQQRYGQLEVSSDVRVDAEATHATGGTGEEVI
jgi:hypothetical protein